MEMNSFQVIDACTACFEQRTVFTQQVLEKSLNKLVLT
jgi:symplekin